MKKHLVIPLLLTLSTPGFADTILGIYGGIGMWNAGMDGNLGVGDQSITSDELGLDDKSNSRYFIALEHPIPLLPNLRLAHSQVSTKGAANVSREFKINDLTFPANADTNTDIDLTHTDLTMYYEILDNWVSVDVGLTARMFDGYAEVNATYPAEAAQGDLNEKEELNGVIPLLYGKAQFDLPFTGWYVGGNINYISVDENSFSDTQLNLGYMSDGLALDFGIEAGVRQMKLKTADSEDLTVDITIDGPYAEFIVHF